jgi:Fe-S-cluster containining protein
LPPEELAQAPLPALTVQAATPAHCSNCDAVCCRLTVVLMPEDDIPGHLTTHTDAGLRVMARDEEGWCVALDSARMCCSIYESRPSICRKFAMAGPYCEDVRADYTERRARGIPLLLY